MGILLFHIFEKVLEIYFTNLLIYRYLLKKIAYLTWVFLQILKKYLSFAYNTAKLLKVFSENQVNQTYMHKKLATILSLALSLFLIKINMNVTK
jgi:hypothetical protein